MIELRMTVFLHRMMSKYFERCADKVSFGEHQDYFEDLAEHHAIKGLNPSYDVKLPTPPKAG